MELMDGSRISEAHMIKECKGHPLPLGVTVFSEMFNFSIASTGKVCNVILYKKGTSVTKHKFPLKKDALSGNIFYGGLLGKSLFEYDYNFEIDGTITIDPYGKKIIGKEIWGEQLNIKKHEVKAAFICPNFNWEGDVPLQISAEEIIAYGLHVRGFTMGRGSKVKSKGTFQGLVEKIPYLKDLGVNQIQCMPVYEFEECTDYTNYWGYGPAYYFAPKGSYSSDSDSVHACKNMIKSYHKEGIEVIFDMPFNNATPAEMIEHCLIYYHLEYHVDGFILNAQVANVQTLRMHPLLANTKILEKDTAFQNTMRCFLKGDEGMVASAIRWFNHDMNNKEKYHSITDHTGFTLYDLVSYDGKHNEANDEQNHDGPDYNYSWNCGAEGFTRRKSINELRMRQIKNAFVLLLTAQGAACILSGDEFGNSQNGNNNVYCQDNEIGWINWGKLKTNQELFLFVKNLIKFRKENPSLYQGSACDGAGYMKQNIPKISYHGENAWQNSSQISSRQLGIYYSSEVNPEYFVAYNMHWVTHSFGLPRLGGNKRWYMIMNSQNGFLKEPLLLEDPAKLILKERTTAVLVGK